MEKKELSVTLIFLGLSLLFVFAALVLFLSKGKSKFWTAKKMKFGAMLLTLTAATTIQSCEEETRMCYDTAELNNMVSIENYTENIDLNKVNDLKGIIEYRSSDSYSFVLKNDSVDTIFQKENLIADDGQFNDTIETFNIKIDTSLESGNYTLSIFDTPVNKQDYSISDYHFKIKND